MIEGVVRDGDMAVSGEALGSTSALGESKAADAGESTSQLWKTLLLIAAGLVSVVFIVGIKILGLLLIRRLNRRTAQYRLRPRPQMDEGTCSTGKILLCFMVLFALAELVCVVGILWTGWCAAILGTLLMIEVGAYVKISLNLDQRAVPPAGRANVIAGGANNQQAGVGANNQQAGVGANNQQAVVGANNQQAGVGANNQQAGVAVNNQQAGVGANNQQAGVGVNNDQPHNRLLPT